MKKQHNRSANNDYYLLVSSIQKRIAKFVAILLVICTIASACLPRNQVLGYTYDFANETASIDETSADYSKYGTTMSSDFDMSTVAIDKEIETLRTADSKTFRRVDGTYVVAVYDTVVHYKDNDVYKEVDNTLAYDSKSGSYRTNANQFSVGLPVAMSEDKFVSVTMGEVGIKWTLIGSSGEEITTSPRTEDTGDKLVLNDVSSKATYVGAKDNVDLEYIVNGMTVKENIILARYEKDFSIGFRYELTELSLSQDELGSWRFVDGEGKAIFTLDSLWMSDAKGEVSENVRLVVKEIGVSQYVLTITPDDEWLSNAAYPVTIDPSLSSATVSMTVEDAYVYSALPSSTYSTYSYLKLAGTSETAFYKSLLKFTLPSQLS
ncbi:MAG: hypothetical protein WC477_07790, partial [Patescibacteria group bacterium]